MENYTINFNLLLQGMETPILAHQIVIANNYSEALEFLGRELLAQHGLKLISWQVVE